MVSALFPNDVPIISWLFPDYISKLQNYFPIISFVCLYALWFSCYFPIISAWFPCVPNYSLIISILFGSLFLSQLFPYYVPIVSQLCPNYVPITSPLFPYYVCMVSLLFPYCFPFSSQYFTYYCPNYFLLFPGYFPIIILLLIVLVLEFTYFSYILSLRYLFYPGKFVNIAYYALCFPLVWIC